MKYLMSCIFVFCTMVSFHAFGVNSPELTIQLDDSKHIHVAGNPLESGMETTISLQDDVVTPSNTESNSFEPHPELSIYSILPAVAAKPAEKVKLAVTHALLPTRPATKVKDVLVMPHIDGRSHPSAASKALKSGH